MTRSPPPPRACAPPGGQRPRRRAGALMSEVSHVLLLSVHGLHQPDLSWYVQHYPASALASLARRSLDYTDALTPVPSDSSPGMVAQATGGDPGVTGIYYDDTYNHDVFPAGTTTCPGPAPGAEVAFEEAIDVNQNWLDAGQGLSGLPGSILQMTSNPRDVINPRTCRSARRRACRSIQPVPRGQHHLQRGPPGWPAHRVVGQAPGLPVTTGPRTTLRPCSTTATRSRPS